MTDSANKIRLSVLDQSPIREGGTAADAIKETIELAQRVELARGARQLWKDCSHFCKGISWKSKMNSKVQHHIYLDK